MKESLVSTLQTNDLVKIRKAFSTDHSETVCGETKKPPGNTWGLFVPSDNIDVRISQSTGMLLFKKERIPTRLEYLLKLPNSSVKFNTY